MNEEIEQEVQEIQEEEVVEEIVEEVQETGVEEEPVPPTEEEPTQLPKETYKAVKEEREKRQEAVKENEELKRQLQDIQSSLNELKPKGQPKDIYEAYDTDPQGVTTDLNKEIERLVGEDPYSNAPQIERLRDLKGELRMREVNNIQNHLKQQTVASKVVQAVTSNIPDFAKKQQELTRFAVEELDYTMEELSKSTDPMRGQEAVKEILRINKLYDKFNAKPEKKVVKQKPTEVEGAGKGIQSSQPNMNALIEKAQQTGDWMEVFEARGLLDD